MIYMWEYKQANLQYTESHSKYQPQQRQRLFSVEGHLIPSSTVSIQIHGILASSWRWSQSILSLPSVAQAIGGLAASEQCLQLMMHSNLSIALHTAALLGNTGAARGFANFQVAGKTARLLIDETPRCVCSKLARKAPLTGLNNLQTLKNIKSYKLLFDHCRWQNGLITSHTGLYLQFIYHLVKAWIQTLRHTHVFPVYEMS